MLVLRPSPDLTQKLATHLAATGFLVGHQTGGGADDRDTEAAEDARDLIVAHVHAATGPRHAADALEGRRTIFAIFQDDGQRLVLLRTPLLLAHVGNVAFGLEQQGDVLLELVRGYASQLVARHGGVSDSRKQIR